MSNNTPRKRTTQFLLLIVLETEPLVFASLVSEGRQIVVRVCQHPDSAVQCKQPGVSMQTVVSDHTAAGRSAVCLSDRLVQSAPAPLFELWRLGHPGGWKVIQGGGRAGAKAETKCSVWRCNNRLTVRHHNEINVMFM